MSNLIMLNVAAALAGALALLALNATRAAPALVAQKVRLRRHSRQAHWG